MIVRLALVTCAVLMLASCSYFSDNEKEVPLEGERISVMQLQKDLEPEKAETVSGDIVLPPVFENAFWPQAGGYPTHALHHVAFSGDAPRKAWSVDIGAGAQDGLPVVASPVVADGLVFTLDTQTTLSAFSIEKGKKIWAENLRPKEEDENVVGGGIAYSEGVLYATNGFANVIALDPKTGKEIWAVALQAPARAAPTVHKGQLYVATLDNKIVALNAQTGAIVWDYQGIGETAGLLGAAAPAVSDEAVIAAFSSGEVFALRPENGSVIWGDNLAPPLRVGGVSGLSDIRALPVVDQGLVVGMSYAGRIAAIESLSGQRIWQRDFGGAETPWVAGDTIFALTKDQQLVALSKSSGAIIWVTQLNALAQAKDKDVPQVWMGPLLAGGRVMIVSSEGVLAEIDPRTGVAQRLTDTGLDVALAPVLAGGTLYLLDQDGTLVAYK